jgi:uncharacterized membrane protein YoaK (UPF0700 family)
MEIKQDCHSLRRKLMNVLKMIGVALGAASASLLSTQVQLPQWLEVTAVVIAVTAAMVAAVRKTLRRSERKQSHDDRQGPSR